MEYKKQVITIILNDHILNEAYYKALFDIFHKEYDVNLHENTNYSKLISDYKTLLEEKLTAYLDKIYSVEDLAAMAQDTNSPLYYRMITQEYKDIITGETQVFSVQLRRMFAEQGEYKRTWFRNVQKFLGLA